MVKSRYPTTRFQVLGFLGVDNPAAISRKQVTEWEREGVVEYLGSVNDVTSVVSAADCVVLPSYYREGVPRTLLEAAAMAKPIITTDAPGCRDTVQDRSTGFLCRTKDSADLAEKMFRLIELPVESRLEMGRLARGKMEREFDESIVIGRYLAVVETLRDSAA
jgi:glycosyltransferase involved in cell wall biosynthesis